MLQFFLILFIVMPGLCIGQEFVLDNLTNSLWCSKIIVTDFNIGGLKEIGLTQFKVPIDSIKSDMSVWEFSNNELKITNYRNGQVVDNVRVKCIYEFDNIKRVIRIFHYSHDAGFWEYSIGTVSTGSYIIMTRRN